MRRLMQGTLIAAMAAGSGCGTEVTPGETSGASGGAGGSVNVGGGSTGSGGDDGDWELLIDGEWELASLTENYTCVVATVPEDMLVAGFRPISPNGTHHTVLTRISGQPDGTYPCDAAVNGENQVYASGVGTEAFHYPSGIGVRLKKGEQLLLNLHLFNLSSESMSGTSGVEVMRMDEADLEYEAETTLAGTFELELPPQSTTTEVGHCTLTEAQTLFGVWPHLHQLGTHIKVTVLQDSGDVVVHDAPYSFDDQRVFLLDEHVQLSPNDQVRVECTYKNTTDAPVYWGDSSLSEMCFAGLNLYPAVGIPFICDH